MPDEINVVITIGARDAVRDACAVQLQREGVGLAKLWARIDRQALLVDEHRLNAHGHRKEPS